MFCLIIYKNIEQNHSLSHINFRNGPNLIYPPNSLSERVPHKSLHPPHSPSLPFPSLPHNADTNFSLSSTWSRGTIFYSATTARHPPAFNIPLPLFKDCSLAFSGEILARSLSHRLAFSFSLSKTHVFSSRLVWFEKIPLVQPKTECYTLSIAQTQGLYQYSFVEVTR